MITNMRKALTGSVYPAIDDVPGEPWADTDHYYCVGVCTLTGGACPEPKRTSRIARMLTAMAEDKPKPTPVEEGKQPTPLEKELAKKHGKPPKK
jgi:hypothetical protein